MKRNEVEYSEKIPGEAGNYGWSACFDDSNGFLGVQRFDKDGELKDRVLLSPKQVEALIAFYRKWHPSKRKAGVHV